MITLTYSTAIVAPKERIWRTMLDDATYRQWTSAFSEGSYVETDWLPGSTARFLGPDGSGLVSRIAEHRPNEFLSLEHLGLIKDGVEDFDSPEVAAWAGARENYTLTEHGDRATLTVDMETTEEARAVFEEAWPKALAELKRLSEARDA